MLVGFLSPDMIMITFTHFCYHIEMRPIQKQEFFNLAPPTTTSTTARHQCPHCELTYAIARTLKAHMDRAHPRDPRPTDPTAFPCECGQSFATTKSRACHRAECPTWQAQSGAVPHSLTSPPTHSAEMVRHLLTCPGLSTLCQQMGVHPIEHPPPITEVIHDHQWVDFLRNALALLNQRGGYGIAPATHPQPWTATRVLARLASKKKKKTLF